MKDFIVCVSGIDIEKRSEIFKLVGFMGGVWSKDLIATTTHLITNTVKSPKYEVRLVIASQSIKKMIIQMLCATEQAWNRQPYLCMT